MTATAATTTPKSLLEKRTELAQQMHAMVAEAGKREDPGLTQEESAQFDKMDADLLRYDDLIKKTARAEEYTRHEDHRQDLEDRSDFHNRKKGDDAPTFAEQRSAVNKFLAGQPLTDRDTFVGRSVGAFEQRGSLRVGQASYDYDGMFVIRALPQAPKNIRDLRENWDNYTKRATTTAQSITTTGGGHTIQNEAMRELEIALLEYGGMRESGATVWRTMTGATMPVPTIDDTTNKSVVLAINTGADVEALVFGQKTFSAYKYTTKQILVPMELDQDSTVPLQSLIAEMFGIRAARGTNNHFTVGVTSDTQPEGIVTGSIVGVTGTGDVNAITYANLVNLVHSVDPAYRRDPSCAWMMNDTTLGTIKKLVDGSSRPLWLPGLSGLAGGFPDTLLGFPVRVNQDMASIASATAGPGATKAIIFGAMNRYKIRDVRDFVALRLVERYAEKAQVGYVGFHRHDGGTVVASTASPPIKHYISKAT